MKVILLILDGWGFSSQKEGNALAQADLPTFRYLAQFYPSILLKASGIAVGLPWKEPGNSEVGHVALGSGQVILHYMPRIQKAIQDGSFFENEALSLAVKNVKQNDSLLHIVGLLGSGLVHSYIDHIYGLLELAKRNGISGHVRLHLFTDGKDSPPQEAKKLLEDLQNELNSLGLGQIATIIGRDYGMDRDFNWGKTKKAFDLIVKGEGEKTQDILAQIEKYYQQGLSDNQIPPTVMVNENGLPYGPVSPSDSVIFFDYREDSARQLTKAFVLPGKVDFRPDVPDNVFFVTFTRYDTSFPAYVAFEPPRVIHTLADVLADRNLSQLHVAETQKYAHATFFFNGMREERHTGEDWIIVPSDDNPIGDKPEMRMPEITQILLNEIEKQHYDFIVANFGAVDIMAHSGNFEATVKACESVDKNVAELVKVIERQEQYILIITADHGHAEGMRDLLSGEILTEHTANDIPLYLVHPKFKKERSALNLFIQKQDEGFLIADVAPTILQILGLPSPSEFNGKSFLPDLKLPPLS